MPEMILYLLKVNMALVLFYAGYYFILQRYTFHTLNRFYLLVGLVYSALYPLIDLSNILNRNQQLKAKISLVAPDWQGSVTYIVSQAEDRAGAYWQIVLMIFWTGVIVMSLRLLIQLISLVILHIQSSWFTLGTFKFRKISKAVNPFSFWRTIYLNPECHEASELRSILEHEQVHVKQLHTFDVMLAELSTIFYWFNPGVWLIKKAIKANLEFITDQEVIRSGIDSREYQYTLLRTQTLPQNSMPVNNFHFLTIKKRIAMINKKPSSRINLSNYLLILPSIMLMVLIVNTSKAGFNNSPVNGMISELPGLEKFTGLVNTQPVTGLEKLTPALQGISNPVKTANAAADTNKLKVVGYGAMTVPELMKVLQSKENGYKSALIDTTRKIQPGSMEEISPKPIVYPLILMNGIPKPYSGDIKKLIKPADILSITVSRTPGTAIAFGPEAIGGVIAIFTKNQGDNPDFTDYYRKKDEAFKYDEIIKSQNRISKSINTEIQAAKQTETDKVILSNLTNQLIILNGKEVSKEEIDLLKVSSISTINVFKGDESIGQYGDKGKNGVIVVTTKK